MSAPVRADRRLGQNFLVDANVLDVIERLAELDPADVVLEVGPGHGPLTERLATRAAHVHAVEIDERFRPHLDERLRSHANVEIMFADALRTDLGALLPAPTKIVANLPYSIATPLLMESLHGLPTVARWCVMVQREVGDRLVAEPGTRTYGAVSVLIQLTAERVGWHPVSRTCFSPVPNVDSALVAFARRRVWGEEFERLRGVVSGAFSHRRKTLANSLALAGVATRDRADAALERAGHLPTVRAEELDPGEFLELASAL